MSRGTSIAVRRSALSMRQSVRAAVSGKSTTSVSLPGTRAASGPFGPSMVCAFFPSQRITNRPPSSHPTLERREPGFVVRQLLAKLAIAGGNQQHIDRFVAKPSVGKSATFIQFDELSSDWPPLAARSAKARPSRMAIAPSDTISSLVAAIGTIADLAIRLGVREQLRSSICRSPSISEMLNRAADPPDLCVNDGRPAAIARTFSRERRAGGGARRRCRRGHFNARLFAASASATLSTSTEPASKTPTCNGSSRPTAAPQRSVGAAYRQHPRQVSAARIGHAATAAMEQR